MKIVLENVFGLLCFVIYQYLCLAKENVNIGVLFNNLEPQILLPLNNSIDPMYTYNKPVDFTSQLQEVSDTDIYYASRTLCKMLANENGVSVILGPTSTITSPMLESICSRFQIPYILTSWKESNEDENKLMLNFYPESTLLSRGIADIITNEHWENFVILYEDEEGLIRLQEVLKLQEYRIGEKKNKVFIKQLGTGPDFRPLLKQLNSIESNIILDCKTENIIPLLIQAKDLNMMEPQDTYILTSLDAHTLDFSLFDTANIITLSIFDYTSDEFKNKIFAWETFGVEPGSGRRKIINPKSITTEAALVYDVMNIFTESVYEVHSEETSMQSIPLQCDGDTTFSNGAALKDSMKTKSGNSDLTGPIEFDDFGNRINFNLYAINPLKDELISSWSAKNTSIINSRSSNESTDQAVHNLQKIMVIVSSRIGEPYLMKVEGDNLEGNDRYKGYSKDLINAIADIIGFKYEFRITEDGKYGNYDERTKKWTGIVGDLLERRAHLGICDLTITSERREVVDFSAPFMTLGISILFKKPDKEDINMFAFMDPFHISVWFYTVTLYLAISVVLYFVSRMTPGDWENPHPCDENPEELENIWDIKNCLWLTLGSIMTQGCDILPKGISSRVAVGMWWFFSLIMTSSYTANLAAFLTKKNLEIPVDSAEALSKQTKIKYGVLKNGATESFFRTSNFSTYQRMWNTMKETKPDVFVTDNIDGVNRVLATKNGLYAFLMESTSIEYHTNRKCELKQIGQWLDNKGFGIAMPINAPYRSVINLAILKMQESGKLQTLKEKWWKPEKAEEKCDTEPEDDGGDLALANVGGVFLLLCVGVGLSISTAIMEFLWNVRNVSVEEHLNYWEALKVELKFAVSFWITKKRTKPELSESSSDKSEKSFKTDEKSMVHSILHNASSFITLNNSSNRPS